MWWRGPPTRSTRSAAACGTTPGPSPAAKAAGRGDAPAATPHPVQATTGPAPETRPLRAVEEPREPHRRPGRQARLDRHAPTLGCTAPTSSRKACGPCSSSRATPAPTPSTGGWPGRAAAGSPRSSKLQQAIRRHRAEINAALDSDLSNALDRVDQHQDPAPHPHRLRVQEPRRPDRPGHARSRRSPACPTRPDLTHGHVRRAGIVPEFETINATGRKRDGRVPPVARVSRRSGSSSGSGGRR